MAQKSECTSAKSGETESRARTETIAGIIMQHGASTTQVANASLARLAPNRTARLKWRITEIQRTDSTEVSEEA